MERDLYLAYDVRMGPCSQRKTSLAGVIGSECRFRLQRNIKTSSAHQTQLCFVGMCLLGLWMAFWPVPSRQGCSRIGHRKIPKCLALIEIELEASERAG